MVAMDASSQVVGGTFGRKTGYELVDNWLFSFINPANPEFLPDYAVDALRQQFPEADDNGDIFPETNIADWIYVARDSDDSFVPAGQTYGSYSVSVDITVENNNCTAQKSL